MSNEFRKKIKNRMSDNQDEKRKRCNSIILSLVGDWLEAKRTRHLCAEHGVSEACEKVDFWKSEMKDRAQDFGDVCVLREPKDVVEMMKGIAEEI